MKKPDSKAKHTFSEQELIEQLGKQLGFIGRSSAAFDQGFEDEAVRLAVCIRVLVHDTDRSTSLLQHLWTKTKIDWWDSAIQFNPMSLIAHVGLTSMVTRVEADGTVTSRHEPTFRAPLPFAGSWQGFSWWWSRQPVIVASKKQQFTRKDLVLSAANKDGGAHVDSQLDEAYAALTRFNSSGWEINRNGQVSPLDNNVAFPSMRQIAHEVLKSLRPHYPQFIQE